MNIEFCVPADKWQVFKDEIMTHFFVSDDPVLTKHNQDFDKDYVYAGFSSDTSEDIQFVKQMVIDFDGCFRY